MLRECMDDVFAYPLYIKLLLFCLKRGSMIFQTPSILYLTKMIIICEQLPLSMIFSDLKIRYFLRRSEGRHKNLTIYLIKRTESFHLWNKVDKNEVYIIPNYSIVNIKYFSSTWTIILSKLEIMQFKHFHFQFDVLYFQLESCHIHLKAFDAIKVFCI